MSNITIVARIKAKKEATGTVKSELIKLVAPTREEAGCIGYKLHQDNDDPEVFVFYENWESAAHLEKHLNSGHFKGCFVAIEGMIEESCLNKLTRIA